MAAKLRVPSYLKLSDNIKIDPHSDEVYIVHSARSDPDDITDRLTRNTVSRESKFHPWSKRAEKVWRKAVIINKNPTFECVTKNKALSITERVSRPTRSSSFRLSEDDTRSSIAGSRPSTRELSAGSSLYSVRRANTMPPEFDLSKPVPRASARPERPILRTPSRQQRSRTPNSEKLPRNVRFQSPLPPMPSRTISRASVASGVPNNSPEEYSSTTKATTNRVTSPKKTASKSSASSSTNKDNNNDSEAAKNKKNIKKDNKASASQENKNMELVLNFFSKLPPV